MKARIKATAAAILMAAAATSHANEEKKHLYLDVHDLADVTAEAVAEAHAKDLSVQSRHGVKFIRYWVDEENGKVYCLSEAPSADAVLETHREAHGLISDTIGEVTQGE